MTRSRLGGALAHGTRLGVLRLLLRQGPDGMPAGEIARATSVPPSTLSSHLAQLEGAGLLRSCRLRHGSWETAVTLCRIRGNVAIAMPGNTSDRGDAGARHVRGADRRCIDQRAHRLLPMARRVHRDLRPGGDDPRLPALQAGAGALWRRPLHHRGYWFTVHVVRQPGGDHRRSLTTFSGIMPVHMPAFIIAQLIGAVVATLLFRWLVGARRPAPAGTDPG